MKKTDWSLSRQQIQFKRIPRLPGSQNEVHIWGESPHNPLLRPELGGGGGAEVSNDWCIIYVNKVNGNLEIAPGSAQNLLAKTYSLFFCGTFSSFQKINACDIRRMSNFDTCHEVSCQV